MSHMSANYLAGKTAKYDVKKCSTQFKILMEMGTEMSLIFLIFLHLKKFNVLVFISSVYCDLLNIFIQFINKI